MHKSELKFSAQCKHRSVAEREPQLLKVGCSRGLDQLAEGELEFKSDAQSELKLNVSTGQLSYSSSWLLNTDLSKWLNTDLSKWLKVS